MKTLMAAFQPFISMTLVCMCLFSCAPERTITKKEAVQKDFFGRSVNFKVGKDKDGNPMMQSDERSIFDGKSNSTMSKSNLDGKDYAKSSYRTARWGSDTKFNTKKYSGNTDANRYQKEPWFVQKQASAQGKTDQVAKKSFFTKLFGTSKAREADSSNTIKSESDAETNVRRRVFMQPEIISFKDNSGLTVQDTNRMLGRN